VLVRAGFVATAQVVETGRSGLGIRWSARLSIAANSGDGSVSASPSAYLTYRGG